MAEDYRDPMHVDTVRARRAADDAERTMHHEIDQEINPAPRTTAAGMVLAVLHGQHHVSSGGEH